jgi:hypothetical protein
MPIKDLGKTLFCGFRSACDLYSASGIVITITPTPQFCFYVSLEMIAVFDITAIWAILIGAASGILYQVKRVDGGAE